jgi:hypothetical protein
LQPHHPGFRYRQEVLVREVHEVPAVHEVPVAQAVHEVPVAHEVPAVHEVPVAQAVHEVPVAQAVHEVPAVPAVPVDIVEMITVVGTIAVGDDLAEAMVEDSRRLLPPMIRSVLKKTIDGEAASMVVVRTLEPGKWSARSVSQVDGLWTRMFRTGIRGWLWTTIWVAAAVEVQRRRNNPLMPVHLRKQPRKW